METTQTVVPKDDLELLKQAKRYVDPGEFLRALVALLTGGARAFRVSIVVREDVDDGAALWFNCENGNIIIAGPHEAVAMLHADVTELLKQLSSEIPSNNTVH